FLLATIVFKDSFHNIGASTSPYYTQQRVIFSSVLRFPLKSTLFPYTTLFRSIMNGCSQCWRRPGVAAIRRGYYQKACWYGKVDRSEEHTSELQSRENLVCRLLLEKKKSDGDIPGLVVPYEQLVCEPASMMEKV